MASVLPKTLLVLAMTAGLAAGISAISVAADSDLTIEKCVELALTNSQEAESRNNANLSAKRQMENAWAQFGPRLTNHGIGIGFSDGSGSTINKQISGTISLGMPVGTSFGQKGLITSSLSLSGIISSLDWENAQMDYTKAGIDISISAKGRFFQYIKAKQALEIAEKKADKAEKLDLADLIAKRAAGLVTDVDVNQGKLALETAKLEVEIAKRNLAACEDELGKVVGLEKIAGVVAPVPDMAQIDMLLSTDIAELKATARKERIDFKQLDNKRRKAEYEYQKNRLAASPNISLSANYDYRNDEEKVGGRVSVGVNKNQGTYAGVDAYYSIPDNIGKSWSVNLSFSMPGILDRGVLKNDMLTARTDFDNTLESLEKAEADLLNEVDQERFNLYTANKRWAQAKEGAALAARSIEISKKKYDLKLMTTADYSEEIDKYEAAQVASVQAGFDVIAAVDALNRTIGAYKL